VRRAALVQLASAVAALTLLALAPIQGPTPRTDGAAAVAVGLATGMLVFSLLGRPGRFALPPVRLVALASAAAATEEVVWRWGVVAGALPLVGAVGALAAGTVGFAFGHVPVRAVHRLPPYVAVGAAFGIVFLVTGRLEAAIAAHCAYNALVVAQER
jgi:membrane protease YdiL (CAAX protease family)